eukprot:1146348-Pelagomonas_calceolata.AAC.1
MSLQRLITKAFSQGPPRAGLTGMEKKLSGGVCFTATSSRCALSAASMLHIFLGSSGRGVAGGEVARGRGGDSKPADAWQTTCQTLAGSWSLFDEALASLLARRPFLIARSRTWLAQSTDPMCPLPGCHQSDSALHMLSGCQNHIISNMKTGRRNIAGRMITKALSKHPVGAGLVYTDIGSDFKLAQHNLQLPTYA